MPQTLSCYINHYTKEGPLRIQLVIERKIKRMGFKLTKTPQNLRGKREIQLQIPPDVKISTVNINKPKQICSPNQIYSAKAVPVRS